MARPDDKVLGVVSDYVWGEMTVMRQHGCTNVEGEVRVEKSVVRADVRAKWPTPADFIVLTFDVG